VALFLGDNGGRPVRLYVWDKVFEEHGYGLAVALADSVEDAITQVGQALRADDPQGASMKGEAELRATEPTIYELTQPVAFCRWGSS